jgi:hypothetical protein
MKGMKGIDVVEMPSARPSVLSTSEFTEQRLTLYTYDELLKPNYYVMLEETAEFTDEENVLAYDVRWAPYLKPIGVPDTTFEAINIYLVNEEGVFLQYPELFNFKGGMIGDELVFRRGSITPGEYRFAIAAAITNHADISVIANFEVFN